MGPRRAGGSQACPAGHRGSDTSRIRGSGRDGRTVGARGWHNGPQPHDRAAFARAFVAAPSPPDPRAPDVGLPRPAPGRGDGGPHVADSRVVPGSAAVTGASHRRAAPGGARSTAGETRGGAIAGRRCPARPSVGAHRSGAAPIVPRSAQRGQGARALTRDHAAPTPTRGSRAAGGGPGSRAAAPTPTRGSRAAGGGPGS
jgi:hypothetical protein